MLDLVTLAVSAAQPGRAETGSPAWTSWGGHSLDELDPKPEHTVDIAHVRTMTDLRVVVCVEKGHGCPEPAGSHVVVRPRGSFRKERKCIR